MILFIVCVWHALVGGVIHPATKITAASSASFVTNTSNALTVTTSAVTTACPPSDTINSGTQLADYLALAVLLFFYVLLHIVLVFLAVYSVRHQHLT